MDFNHVLQTLGLTATFAAVAVAVWYACLTRRLVQSNDLPLLTVEVPHSLDAARNVVLGLHAPEIINIGKGPALNIVVLVEDETPTLHGSLAAGAQTMGAHLPNPRPEKLETARFGIYYQDLSHGWYPNGVFRRRRGKCPLLAPARQEPRTMVCQTAGPDLIRARRGP